MAETTKATKNSMVQVFRALAIFAVVMIHTSPSGIGQVYSRPFINFAVATFLFLSGYLTKLENDNWSSFFKKRIIRVLVPYVIWSVIYTLYSRHLEKLPFNLLTAQATVPFYFIFVYIQFVLLTPLLGKLAKSRFQFLGWFVAPISIIVFKYYWILSGREPDPNISLIWSDICLGWFTFYYLGLILGNRIMEKHYSLRTLVILYVLSIVLQIAEGYGLFLLGDKFCGTQLKLSSLLTTTVFLLIAYTILKSDKLNINNRFLIMLGDYSFGIYLCHIMVIHAFAAFVPFYRSIPFPISSAIVLVISFCCCYVADRLLGHKFSRWLGIR